jgi:hypothetical protein
MDSDTGSGGKSGNVSYVKVNSPVKNSNPFEIFAGVPSQNLVGGNKSDPGRIAMDGLGAGSSDGSIGSVSHVRLFGPTSSFEIGKADAAGGGNMMGGTTAQGGNGGDIDFVTALAGTLDVLAPSGGDSQGTPGHGGSIHGLYSGLTGKSVHLIAAGNGGSSLVGGTGGAGGSLSYMDILGDIGDFKATFGLATGSDQGGLVVGEGGTNGTVDDVHANRIATLIAGRPDAGAITYANDVSKVSHLYVNVLGANTGIKGDHSERGTNGQMFDWSGGSDAKFEPDSAGDPLDGDSANDGLVILGPNAGKLPVIPLLLVQEHSVG